jgi:hypothetical protein
MAPGDRFLEQRQTIDDQAPFLSLGQHHEL